MKFTIGLVQLESVLGDTRKNLDLAIAAIKEAAGRNAKFICLPETFLTGYNLGLLGDRLFGLAERLDGESTMALRSLAKELGVYLIAPMALKRDGDSKLDNAAVFIGDDGGVIGVYNKNHVFGGAEGEGAYFATCGEYPVYDTPYGRIGILICYDMNFPEPARILALKGAKLIFAPCAWRVQDIDVWQLVTAARANENTVYLAAVNAWQESENLHLFGQSRILTPRGQVMAQANEKGTVILLQELDLGLVDEYRRELPYLSHRNPGTYSAVS
jgi:predicted amidohydrolase